MKALLLAALVTAACSNTHSDPTTEREQFATEVGEDYVFTFTRFCECTAEYGGTFRVYVTAGVVANATDLAGTQTSAEILATLPTIDDIFDTIDTAEVEGAASVVVEYDPNEGYPTSVAIDYSEQIADEEYSVSVRDVVRINAD